MKFSLNNLLNVFGNNKELDENHAVDLTKSIIEEIEAHPFAISKKNVLYGGIDELAGYYYFHTIVVGALKIKTQNGAKLHIEGDGFNLELNSDMEELESDYSKANRTITKLDFEIEKEDIPKIDKTLIKHLTLKVKNKKIDFKIIKD
jgi:hypothetical protein